MNVLLDMLHKRAEDTYDGPVPNAENYGIWIRHWFATAIALRNEFVCEELYRTADALTEIINVQTEYCKKYLDNIA